MSFLGFDWTVWAVLVPAFFFFLWYDKRKKARYGDNARPGMIFMPVPGQPAKRSSPLKVVLLFIAVIVGLFMAADWLNGHMPRPR